MKPPDFSCHTVVFTHYCSVYDFAGEVHACCCARDGSSIHRPLSPGADQPLKPLKRATGFVSSPYTCNCSALTLFSQGKMRIGLAESTVLVALAHASVLSQRDASGEQLRGEALQEELAEAERTIKQVLECALLQVVAVTSASSDGCGGAPSEKACLRVPLSRCTLRCPTMR